MAQEREQFKNSLTAVMAMAGAAIGLGNIWRFPYMVGQNGGAAFIIVYLLSSLLLAIPVLLAESIIGRNTGLGTFGAMEKIAPGSRWKWMGLLTIVSPLIILSYYSVVGGWSIQYLIKACATGFGENATSFFSTFISSTWSPLLFHTLFLLLTGIIVLAGVTSGIEKFNKLSLPLLFVLVVALAAYSISLPGSSEGVRYLLKPDFSKLDGSAVASAMGQSFFSLSLGVGTILTYSSYMKKDGNILVNGLGTAGFDLIFAYIAGFAIMPAVFAAGIKPDAGPSLVFETLPFIFGKISATSPLLSRIMSVLFFLTCVFAALTSSISMYEVGVSYLVDEKKMSRPKAVALIFGGTWSLGTLCSLSFGPLSGLLIFGSPIFDFCDKLTSNFLMTFGALLFVIFVGWKMKKSEVEREITNDGTKNRKSFRPIFFIIRYVAPVLILINCLANFH